MSHPFIFWATFLALASLVYFCDKKYGMLRDASTATPRPYSWSRVQLAWWTVIVFSSYITIILRSHGSLPDFNNSILYLLGISSATTIGAMLIDVSDQSNPALSNLSQNDRGNTFFLDILSDKNGISIHRFQTIIFNIVFGIWFIGAVLQRLAIDPPCAICAGQPASGACITCLNNYARAIMPFIPSNDLILMSISSGLYEALKITENRQPTISDTQPLKVADEGFQKNNPSVKG